MSQSANQVVRGGNSSSLMDVLRAADLASSESGFAWRAYEHPSANRAPAKADDPQGLIPLIVERPLAFLSGLALAVMTVAGTAQLPAEWATGQPFEVMAAWAGQGADTPALMQVAQLPEASPEPVRQAMVEQAPMPTPPPAPVVMERAAPVVVPPPVSPRELPAPRLLAGGTVEGPVATMFRVPIEIVNSEQLQPDSVLLVTNVPDYAALSEGRPIGAGTWVVPASRAGNLGIIAYAQPAAKQRLAFELLSAEGALISRSDALLNVSQPDRYEPAPVRVTSAMSTKRASRVAESTVHGR
jgi:hypothetical protein